MLPEDPVLLNMPLFDIPPDAEIEFVDDPKSPSYTASDHLASASAIVASCIMLEECKCLCSARPKSDEPFYK